ncbi:MAG: hypothetical protein EAZ67_04785 [Cytophagales bacterium]|nr:MAG: hypothetical protein EAZ67_04785 [Cytophagales bacterium]
MTHSRTKKNMRSAQKALVENVDFYMEGSYMVFTATYLSERGYCCKSACRHCPYGFRREACE